MSRPARLPKTISVGRSSGPRRSTCQVRSAASFLPFPTRPLLSGRRKVKRDLQRIHTDSQCLFSLRSYHFMSYLCLSWYVLAAFGSAGKWRWEWHMTAQDGRDQRVRVEIPFDHIIVGRLRFQVICFLFFASSIPTLTPDGVLVICLRLFFFFCPFIFSSL